MSAEATRARELAAVVVTILYDGLDRMENVLQGLLDEDGTKGATVIGRPEILLLTTELVAKLDEFTEAVKAGRKQ